MKFIDNEEIKKINNVIIGNKNLESSTNELYKFFRRFFPLDFITMPFFNAQDGTLRYRTFVAEDGVIPVDDTIRLSEAAHREAQRIVSNKIIYIKDVLQNSITQEIAAHLGIQNPASTLIVMPVIGPSRYCALSLVADGRDMYKENHLRLMEEIYEPVTGLVRYLSSQFELASIKESFLTENAALRKRLGYRIIGSGSGLKKVMDLVEQAAPLDVPILLTGETGVGKEVVANAIHRRSRRADGPLISINCGAIAESLMDSELFGHEKGAFTGATGMKRGYFEQADSGTIFLDEISEMSPQVQMKLLRVLQTMTFQRVGGQRFISVNVRVIAASNRELPKMIERNEFRKDLWFRLSTFPIHIPPLRERREDIPILAEHFARRKSAEMNLPYEYRFGAGAMKQLQDYDWPGNVRELLNVLERALIICRGEPLSFPNLDASSTSLVSERPADKSERFLTMEEMASLHIKKSLELTKGRIEGPGGAAELLGMNPSTLRGRMRKLGIQITKVTL